VSEESDSSAVAKAAIATLAEDELVVIVGSVLAEDTELVLDDSDVEVDAELEVDVDDVESVDSKTTTGSLML